MSTVCLSRCFCMGKPYFGARGTPFAVLDDTHTLTMMRTCDGPKLSSMRCEYSRLRGMRHLDYLVMGI